VSAVELEDVVVSRGVHAVVHGVSLAIEQGETVALVGASGSGKTSLLRAILGLTPLTRGTVKIGGAIASRGSEIVLAPERRNLSVVFQDVALWPNMTVRGNLAFALESRGVERTACEQRIEAMLEHVGLTAHAKRFPRELSGGERQRVSLARALVVEPAAVLLDEPLTNLDVLLQRELLELVRRTFHERESTALYVTHDPREARVLGDRIAVLDRGKLVQCGTWDELRDAPATELVAAITT